MTATITWTIAQLERSIPEGGVTTAHWRVTAVDGGYSASAYGSAGFTPDPTSPDFVPYDQLTEADVLDWVWGKLDKAEVEAALATALEAQKTPPVVYGTPW
jgi:hypothetical protein